MYVDICLQRIYESFQEKLLRIRFSMCFTSSMLCGHSFQVACFPIMVGSSALSGSLSYSNLGGRWISVGAFLRSGRPYKIHYVVVWRSSFFHIVCSLFLHHPHTPTLCTENLIFIVIITFIYIYMGRKWTIANWRVIAPAGQSLVHRTLRYA